MLLKTRILLVTLLTFTLLAGSSFIFGYIGITGILGTIIALLLAAIAIYKYIQNEFQPLYSTLEKLPDFSRKPADISEIAYLNSALKKFLEPPKENPEDKARQNKLIISNEILSHLNDTITEMVDSLGQGFLTFDMEGRCGSIYSKKCLDLLGMDPAGKSIFEVLAIPESEQEQINDLMEMIFMPPSHAVPIDDFLSFFPQEINPANSLVVKLDYKGIIGKGGYVKKVVLIATDRTYEIEAQSMLNAEKNKAKTIIKINQRRKDFVVFIKDLRSMLAMLNQSPEKIQMNKLKMELHTSKGVAGVFALSELVEILHNVETKLNSPDVNFIDCANEIEGELKNVLSLAKLLLGENFEQIGEMRQINMSTINEFAKKLNDNKNPLEVKEEFMANFVATLVSEIVNGFDSHIYDVSADLWKRIAPIQLESNINSIVIDKYSYLFSTFTHIFNNIVDHGIELPEKRIEAGKIAEGHIKMGIFLEKSENKESLRITIEDDGGGIDPEKIRKKLKESDPDGDWVKESDEEVIQRIFNFGFSTKKEVSTLSGRGIGMDAVKEAVDNLGGTIHVQSKINEGTKFLITI